MQIHHHDSRHVRMLIHPALYAHTHQQSHNCSSARQFFLCVTLSLYQSQSNNITIKIYVSRSCGTAYYITNYRFPPPYYYSFVIQTELTNHKNYLLLNIHVFILVCIVQNCYNTANICTPRDVKHNHVFSVKMILDVFFIICR